MSVPRLLVVGGNGYLVCKAAVSKGWQVSSMSSSGKPFTTPAGHTPKWVERVDWHKASAFEPASYKEFIGNATAVVHTLGILLEDKGYKQAVRDGNVLEVLQALGKGATGSGEASNPLKTSKDRSSSYDAMNRDSAIEVLNTMLEAKDAPNPRSFVYVSAADVFPIVPRRYFTSKREAEEYILSHCTPQTGVHPVIVRPGLMYNAHIRPVTTVPAFALSVTAGIHDKLGLKLPFSGDNFFGRAAESLKTHPIHVDHVADAIVKCIAEDREGVVEIPTMRKWAGFDVPEAGSEGEAKA